MIVVMQARLCSTRLPGKAFFNFFGQNMIERACSIAREIKGVDRIVLATGNRPENLALKPYVEKMEVEFFVGSENNVLERFYQAIKNYSGEYLLRMTCDNYLIQPDVIEGLHDIAKAENSDYAFISPLSHYSGEIVKCKAIIEGYNQGYSREAAEHVTWDIRNDPKKTISVLPSEFLGLNHNKSFTLDTLEDLVTMKKLEMLYPELSEPRCIETLKLIETKPI